jgi:hypothetical protein
MDDSDRFDRSRWLTSVLMEMVGLSPEGLGKPVDDEPRLRRVEGAGEAMLNEMAIVE